MPGLAPSSPPGVPASTNRSKANARPRPRRGGEAQLAGRVGKGHLQQSEQRGNRRVFAQRQAVHQADRQAELRGGLLDERAVGGDISGQQRNLTRPAAIEHDPLLEPAQRGADLAAALGRLDELDRASGIHLRMRPSGRDYGQVGESRDVQGRGDLAGAPINVRQRLGPHLQRGFQRSASLGKAPVRQADRPIAQVRRSG